MAGTLTVITGPMRSAKTSLLVQMLTSMGGPTRHLHANRSWCFHPIDGVRSFPDRIQGRGSAASFPSMPVASPDQIPRDKLHGITVGIDEAQLMPVGKLREVVTQLVDRQDCRVVLAGLNTDYRRVPFEWAVWAMPIAERVTVLPARCNLCSGEASFTYRDPSVGKARIIVGDDIYAPLCRSCYLKVALVADAARTRSRSRTPTGFE